MSWRVKVMDHPLQFLYLRRTISVRGLLGKKNGVEGFRGQLLHTKLKINLNP